MWPVCGACTVRLFEHLSTLMINCAQSGGVSWFALNSEGSWEKSDPASSTRSYKKGLNDNNNRLLGIVNEFCIPFGTKSKIVICGGLDSAAL